MRKEVQFTMHALECGPNTPLQPKMWLSHDRRVCSSWRLMSGDKVVASCRQPAPVDEANKELAEVIDLVRTRKRGQDVD